MHSLYSSLPDLLSTALEKMDKGDLVSAFKLSDRACRLGRVSDPNALLLRATVLSKKGCIAEAVSDLKLASLAMPENHKVAFSLLRLCHSDLHNFRELFKQTLIFLLRQDPKISLLPEVVTWISKLNVKSVGAAWRINDFIVGWAVSFSDSATKILIELDSQFFYIETGMASPWLIAEGVGNGFNAFRLKLPDKFNLLRIGISGNSLCGSPFISHGQIKDRNNEISPVSNVVDVIIPVYSGYEETLACLDSIKKAVVKTAYRVLVVNDSSPDERLIDALKLRAKNKEIVLINRPINAGFAGAVNMALQIDQNNDVVVLNSDTLVFGNWLDRLKMSAYSKTKIASVTPLSNHGELVSYPTSMINNPLLCPNHAEQVDQLFSSLGVEEPCSIPVGVGFCIYIKRRALNEIGLFDEGLFGRGYGEDTDLCLRFQAHGWQNVCAQNVYVGHWGSRSFKDEKKYLVAQNLPRLYSTYPKHEAEYDDFLTNDPLKELRRKVQRLWLTKIMPQQNAVLCLGESTVQEGSIAQISSDFSAGTWKIFLKINGLTGLDAIDYDWPRQWDELKEDIIAGGFTALELRTLGLFPAEFIDLLTEGFIPYFFVLQDYSAYCPRKYRLIEEASLCEDPIEIDHCDNCIRQLGPLVYGFDNVIAWQERGQRILSHAEEISAINDDLQHSYVRRFPNLNKKISKKSLPKTIVTVPSISLQQASRIAVLMANQLDTGFLALVEQARISFNKNLEVEFIVMGNTLDDELLQNLPNTHVVGKVSDDELLETIKLYECDAIADFSPRYDVRKFAAQIAESLNLPLVQQYTVNERKHN